MRDKLGTRQRGIFSLLVSLALATLLITGCATTKKDVPEEVTETTIEQLTVSTSQLETAVEIVNSGSTPYTAFRLVDPPRVILDIRGVPGSVLPREKDVKDGHVKEIRFEEGKPQADTTRMVVNLERLLDYKVSAVDNTIRLSLIHKAEEEAKAPYTASEPRIHFKPRTSDLNQVLGIDFTLLDRGKSRLTITTDKKVLYDLDRKGEKSLVLELSGTTIPPLLLREIDPSHFAGALERVKPSFSSAKKKVSLDIILKEMVPFHVTQTENSINIEFGQTSIQPVEKKIVPLQLVEARAEVVRPSPPDPSPPEKPPEKKEIRPKVVPNKVAPKIEGLENEFTGELMYLDFVNADVTHILRLINEVSKENIIWDPAIKGRKVSMILKGVPWDEALELILKNNNLAKKYVGAKILWITTKAKMKKIVAEEEAEEKKRKQRIAEERKRREAKKKKAKEEEPLIIEYLPVDFKAAKAIKGHIHLTKRGKISIDTSTNTLIIRDTAESIEEARKTVRQFDVPIKQIMIEARIVDASSNFTRSLGVQWESPGITRNWKKNINRSGWGFNPAQYTTPGDLTVGGTFTSNAPDKWGKNIDLSFAWLSNGGLGTLALDAALALAESEGTAKIMSAPKVIAREGTAATISSGDSIIIPATENVASTTIDATLSLSVTPTTVSFNDFITLKVNVSDNEAPSTSRIIKKTISTTLMIKSGETVVIGGILKESNTEDQAGIPWLRDIPILGWLFKARTKAYTRKELLIFITPTVLPAPTRSL
ncbi:MAG: type IV pilus secretin PilQ [Desulfobacteraceae bacterium]|nr:type IV pilus secretin PilQ [Desulfobacteraceae bacterium]